MIIQSDQTSIGIYISIFFSNLEALFVSFVSNIVLHILVWCTMHRNLPFKDIASLFFIKLFCQLKWYPTSLINIPFHQCKTDM